jgi:hypothetical protein
LLTYLRRYQQSRNTEPRWVIFTQPPGGQTDGGNYNVWQGAVVNDQTLLVGSTTSTETNAQGGVGRVMVVSTTDPAHPTLLRELDIPGTVHVRGIAIEGEPGAGDRLLGWLERLRGGPPDDRPYRAGDA